MSGASAEAAWLACTEPLSMLSILGRQTRERKLRLFGCACCRRIWHLLSDESARRVVEVAEQYADGHADSRELEAAFIAAGGRVNEPFGGGGDAGAALVAARATALPGVIPFWLPDYAADAVRYEAFRKAVAGGARNLSPRIKKTEQAAQALLLRCIIGNPFRSASVEPAWRSWGSGCVRKLAQAIYDGRRFADLPVLADALEEAGCDNADILAHCRQPGEHVRGCWVVDAILGKA
jgi:hypothetical protein